MTSDTVTTVSSVLTKSHNQILADWVKRQLADADRPQGVTDSSLKNTSSEFLKLFQDAAKDGNLSNLETPEWELVKRMLAELSASRAVQGSSPTQTANFVFSLKQPIFEHLSKELGQKNEKLAEAFFSASTLLDRLGLYTSEIFQKSREAIIRRQQKDMLEMSTPVINLWEDILAVPLIGTLDSARTQIVMESLLQAIVDTGSKIAILDITGVPTVDTQTAQHLLKTVAATRKMGADCIISGIRPQIAQTIVHLGIDIYDITTKASMSDALKEALKRTGSTVSRQSDSAKE